MNTTAEGAASEEEKALTRQLTTFCGKALTAMTEDEVVNGMMSATITVALFGLSHKDLAAWLRRLATEVEARGAERARNAN